MVSYLQEYLQARGIGFESADGEFFFISVDGRIKWHTIARCEKDAFIIYMAYPWRYESLSPQDTLDFFIAVNKGLSYGALFIQDTTVVYRYKIPLVDEFCMQETLCQLFRISYYEFTALWQEVYNAAHRGMA